MNNLISCYQRHFLVERAIYRCHFTKRLIEFYRNRLEGLCNDFVYWDTVFYILLVDNHVVNSSFVSTLNIVMDFMIKT